ncbi:dihydrofolate reductase, fragment [Erwinia phage phiEa116]|nr:dihydrofolate reductase, fragment [Erwinia phage phiEa116]
MIATVYAINSVGAFGNYDGSLPWPKNSEDLMRFSEITKNIITKEHRFRPDGVSQLQVSGCKKRKSA